MNEAVTLKVSDDIVERIVRSEITASVAKALGGAEDRLIPELVAQVLTLKVNSKGKVGNYSSENRYTYLEYTIGNAIRTHARDAVAQWLAKNAPKIQKSLEVALTKSTKGIAQDFVKSLETNAKSAFHVDVNIRGEDGYGEFNQLKYQIKQLEKQIAEMAAKK